MDRRQFGLGAALIAVAAARPAMAAGPEAIADAVLAEEMRVRGIPGLQCAVVKSGKVVFRRAIGVANLQYGVPVSDKSIFAINSITKAFTGVAVMQLVAEGRVDLAAQISVYIADLPETWRPITIRQLLSHMTGLPNIIDNGSGALIAKDEAATWALVQTRPLYFPPGERFNYCQTNYVLLGMVIAKLRGKPFVEVFAERQFAPAGMSDTLFGDSRDIIANGVQTYGLTYPRKLAPPVLVNNIATFSPMHRTASGLNSTADDMARWIIALRAGRLGLDAAALKTLWTAERFNDRKEGEWAKGWVTVARSAHPAVGGTGGGRSACYIYPEDDLAVIILTNLNGGYPEEICDRIAQAFVPGLKLNGAAALRVALQGQPKPDVPATYARLKRERPDFEIGEVELNNWAYRLMRTEKALLALDLFKLTTDLFPQSSNAFDSLADSYAWLERKDLAIAAYERSVKLDPGNTHGAERIKALRGS